MVKFLKRGKDLIKTFKAGNFNFSSDRKTYIMGILNITPDSFFEKSRFLDPDMALKKALEMQELGADIIDIGAQSTRPGYIEINENTELERLVPVLKKLKGKIKIPISIDTFYPKVAKVALQYGASIINDVHGFKNEKMWEIVSKTNCGCILMHDGAYSEFENFLKLNLKKAEKYSIDPKRICFDPGIGFGKNYEEDLLSIKNTAKIINNIAPENFSLVGLSNKRVIKNSSEAELMEDRLFGTIAANAISAMNGINITRVHAVKETILALKTVDAILNSKDVN